MTLFFLAKNNDATNPNAKPWNPLCTVLMTNLLKRRSACNVYSIEYGKIFFETPRRKLLIYLLLLRFVNQYVNVIIIYF